jgi:hypothetical protein
MRVAKACAQAASDALSGDALEIEGDMAAVAARMSPTVRIFMVVFLDGQKYQRPTVTLGWGVRPHKREKLGEPQIFLMCMRSAT